MQLVPLHHKLVFIFISIALFLLIITKPAFAIDMAGDYTLPYPSAMPGGFAYKISKVTEKIQGLWSFGNLAQFEYHLRMSDKYLVQSKTLFEYRQYLLAYNALQTSNEHYSQLNGFLNNAKNEGKNITAFRETLQKASRKHNEVLTGLKKETPAEFYWTPEKTAASHLEIHTELESSIKLRNTNL